MGEVGREGEVAVEKGVRVGPAVMGEEAREAREARGVLGEGERAEKGREGMEVMGGWVEGGDSEVGRVMGEVLGRSCSMLCHSANQNHTPSPHTWRYFRIHPASCGSCWSRWLGYIQSGCCFPGTCM